MRMATFDIETEGFKHGRTPTPFMVDIFDGQNHVTFDGPTCIRAFLDYLADLKKPLQLFAHNGGKFDFNFFLHAWENPIKIINGRVVKCRVGIHTLQDSWAILPVPLRMHDKGEIDYSFFELDQWRDHAQEITTYLHRDTESLFSLVSAFIDRFGKKLTIGGTAIKELEKRHPVEYQGESHDKTFRQFYHGGRVQCFRKGTVKGNLNIYDVNSMYPYVMANVQHPTGTDYDFTDSLSVLLKTKRPFFIKFLGENDNALPLSDGESLSFETREGIFAVPSHEFLTAYQAGTIRISKVIAAWIPKKTIAFADYVECFMSEKISAKTAGDKTREIFAKLLLNSAYGKFGSNPANYKDWLIVRDGEETQALENGFEPSESNPWFEFWNKPARTKKWYDVAIAASITGAARSVMLNAIMECDKPIYCDTDSLICETLNQEINPTKLGAWKYEGFGDTAYIAGKKMYAVFNGSDCIKFASKGIKALPADIKKIAQGDKIVFNSIAPTFKRSGCATFQERTIRRT